MKGSQITKAYDTCVLDLLVEVFVTMYFWRQNGGEGGMQSYAQECRNHTHKCKGVHTHISLVEGTGEKSTDVCFQVYSFKNVCLTIAV